MTNIDWAGILRPFFVTGIMLLVMWEPKLPKLKRRDRQ